MDMQIFANDLASKDYVAAIDGLGLAIPYVEGGGGKFLSSAVGKYGDEALETVSKLVKSVGEKLGELIEVGLKTIFTRG